MLLQQVARQAEWVEPVEQLLVVRLLVEHLPLALLPMAQGQEDEVEWVVVEVVVAALHLLCLRVLIELLHLPALMLSEQVSQKASLKSLITIQKPSAKNAGCRFTHRQTIPKTRSTVCCSCFMAWAGLSLSGQIQIREMQP